MLNWLADGIALPKARRVQMLRFRSSLSILRTDDLMFDAQRAEEDIAGVPSRLSVLSTDPRRNPGAIPKLRWGTGPDEDAEVEAIGPEAELPANHDGIASPNVEGGAGSGFMLTGGS